MVTIREIAQSVGVSPATVSRVLNYDATLSISAAKRQAIIETAEALNYLTPRNRNRAGGWSPPGLAGNPKVVLVHSLRPADELADPYYVGVRLGIEHRCRELGIESAKVYLGDGMDNPALIAGASGLIAVGRTMPDQVNWLRQVNRNLVFADVCPPVETCDRVQSDLGFATEQLLDGLWAAGYRRIAFIGAEEQLRGAPRLGEPRTAAYLRWTAARGVADPDLCDVGRMCFEDGYDLARAMLARKRPEVIIGANDNMAIGAYRAILEAGLSIPGDIGVVGFNDIPAAQFLAPPLTTVRIQAERIGESAVDLIAELIGGRDYYKKVVISTEIVWRESCRSPADAAKAPPPAPAAVRKARVAQTTA